MNRTQKAVFVGLGVILILFVVIVIHGQTIPSCTDGDQVCAQRYQAGGGMKMLGRLFESSGNRVKLPQSRHVLAAGQRQRIDVPADPDAKLRTLRLKLVTGQQMQIQLFNKESSPGLDLSGQENQYLPRDEDGQATPQERRTLTLTVTRGGGTLIMACPPISDCELESS